MKKYSKNKIEADNLIKQVRQKIKETTWEKQNLREGFTETFKPLISQFEDPGEDSKKQNIFTQNQKMLQNQLALTEGIRANQKAITDGFSQFERLADMQELPGIEAIEEEEEEEKEEKVQITITKEFFDKYLNNKKSQDILEANGYFELPSEYFDKDIDIIGDRLDNVNSDLLDLNDKIKGKVEFKISQEGYQFAVSTAKKRGPTPETIEQINSFNTLNIYGKNLSDLYKFKKLKKTGSGLFTNPQELLRRFELVNGSLAAGNNGVLPEFIQIAHRLRDLGVLTNKQLNTLLKKVIQT